MQLTKKCPCCEKNITFYKMYRMWSKASKTNEKFIHCPFCEEKIGNLSIYERYGLFGALPLFGMPLIYDDTITAYIIAGVILLYTLLLFYLLYRLISLKCMGNADLNTVQKENTDDKHNLLAVLIISLIFFISIFAVFVPLFQK